MSSGFALKRRLTLKNLSSVSSLLLCAVFALVPGAIKSHAQLPVDVSSGRELKGQTEQSPSKIEAI